MIYIQLIYNLSMLIALSVLSGFVGKKEKIDEKQKSILQGIIFGMVAVVGMLYPVKFAPGLIFDGRSVVISLCALFFGPLSALVSALLPAVLRVFQGGVGTLPGILVIVESALLGLLFHYRFYRKNKAVYVHTLLLMGLLVHLVMLSLMLMLPADIAWDVVQQIGLPVISIYPAATILIGKIISDNLEKHRFLASLKAGEEKYRMLIENQTDLVVKVDKEGRFVYVSPGYCKTFGKTEKELIGNTFFPLVHEEDVGSTKKEMEKLHSPPYSCYIEQRAMTKDGWRWFGWTDTAEINDKKEVVSIIGVGRDITEKKQAEVELEHSHELMKYIIEHDRSAVAVHDRYMNYIYVSDKYLKDYNVKEFDIIGKNHYEVFPDLPEKWREIRQRVLNGETLSAEDDPFERYDGTKLWTSWECRPWYLSDGKVGGLIVYTEVINERKNRELELEKKINELNQTNSVMIGREIKMTELKEEINGLLRELGREKKY